MCLKLTCHEPPWIECLQMSGVWHTVSRLILLLPCENRDSDTVNKLPKSTKCWKQNLNPHGCSFLYTWLFLSFGVGWESQGQRTDGKGATSDPTLPPALFQLISTVSLMCLSGLSECVFAAFQTWTNDYFCVSAQVSCTSSGLWCY